ncbi:MAG: hypothetical protein ACT4TC_18425, partial [Myxococcaceae bacterium]
MGLAWGSLRTSDFRSGVAPLVKRERALLASLTEVGQQSPVVVREMFGQMADSGFVLLAGSLFLRKPVLPEQPIE